MFNKTNFDRSLYDRSIGLDFINAALQGKGNLSTNITIQSLLNIVMLNGIGNIDVVLRLKNSFETDMISSGKIEVTDLILRMPMTISLSGNGNIELYPSIQTPNSSAMLGNGFLTMLPLNFKQEVLSGLFGKGEITVGIALYTAFLGDITSFGDLQIKNFTLRLPIVASLYGSGDLEMRRLGAVNSETMEFENLGLAPGQTLIIDTDEYNIFINDILDVSSVTSDSIFFQLQPGENELVFISPNNPNLEVTIVWQNRWL